MLGQNFFRLEQQKGHFTFKVKANESAVSAQEDSSELKLTKRKILSRVAPVFLIQLYSQQRFCSCENWFTMTLTTRIASGGSGFL